MNEAEIYVIEQDYEVAPETLFVENEKAQRVLEVLHNECLVTDGERRIFLLWVEKNNYRVVGEILGLSKVYVFKIVKKVKEVIKNVVR